MWVELDDIRQAGNTQPFGTQRHASHGPHPAAHLRFDRVDHVPRRRSPRHFAAMRRNPSSMSGVPGPWARPSFAKIAREAAATRIR
jgi:hypothetical protein